MKIGLIDVDGHNYPNLAIMKLSAYHKSKGDEVEMVVPGSTYDKVYMSKVFTFTEDYKEEFSAKEVVRGGTGYNDYVTVLPEEVEHTYPDYEIYKVKNKAYGYLTRGCPRGCPFCIVADKEGKKSYKVADLKEFWKGQKEIILSDPNILASPNRIELLQQLIDSKALVDFNQGLDARLLNEEVCELLSKIKIKMMHFAWDRMDQSELIIKNLLMLKKYVPITRRNTMVYVLTNYETTFEQDLNRVYTIRDVIGIQPYIMIYNKGTEPKNVRRLQRYCNWPAFLHSPNMRTFEEYCKLTYKKP